MAWTYALHLEHDKADDENPYDQNGEVERRVISRDTPLNDRYGLEYLTLTRVELAALQSGALLEVSIMDDEYTLIVVMEAE